MCSCPHVRRKVRCFAQRTAKTKDQKKRQIERTAFPSDAIQLCSWSSTTSPHLLFSTFHSPSTTPQLPKCVCLPPFHVPCFLSSFFFFFVTLIRVAVHSRPPPSDCACVACDPLPGRPRPAAAPPPPPSHARAPPDRVAAEAR